MTHCINWLYVCCLPFVLMTMGCESGNDSARLVGSSPTLSDKESLIKVKLHDKPVMISGKTISEVIVNVREVQLIDEFSQKLQISNNLLRLDLLELVDDVTAGIGHAVVPAGRYSQLRLLLSADNLINVDGSVEPLRIPSGIQTGIKITPPAGQEYFELRGGRITHIVLDFDAQRSIHYSPGQGFMLKPVVKLTSIASLTFAQEQKISTNLGGIADAMIEASDLIVESITEEEQGVSMIHSAVFGYQMPYTLWSVRTTDVLKGNEENPTVRTPGARVGSYVHLVTHAAQLKAGEKSILLLRQQEDGTFGVTNGAQGKVDL